MLLLSISIGASLLSVRQFGEMTLFCKFRVWTGRMVFGVLAAALLMQASPAQGQTSGFRGVLGSDDLGTACLQIEPDKACPNGASCACPNGTSCQCYYGNGRVSGSVGVGYGKIFINSDKTNVLPNCEPFNGSLFIIANRDLEELQLNGTFCDSRTTDTYQGTYEIVKSAKGRTGSGIVKGSAYNFITLHFTEKKQ